MEKTNNHRIIILGIKRIKANKYKMLEKMTQTHICIFTSLGDEMLSNWRWRRRKRHRKTHEFHSIFVWCVVRSGDVARRALNRYSLYLFHTTHTHSDFYFFFVQPASIYTVCRVNFVIVGSFRIDTFLR